jgi:hypothetical protein
MKNIYLIFSIASLFCFSTSSLWAVKPVKNTPASQEITKERSEKEIKKLEKLEKRIQKKVEKMNAKANAEVDFDDPVDKWMWFWIFSWGLGLGVAFLDIFISIGILGFISSALFLFGFVALVLWLVKKFG